MIIKSKVLTTGKDCKTPLRYTPNREVFDTYAHYYMKEPQELFDDTAGVVNDPQEDDDMSSEEIEDNEIRATDRMAVALTTEDTDFRMDVYIFDSETAAFYVHHDEFLHGTPTDLALVDRNEDPLALISNEDGTVSTYRLFVTNHFLPDSVIAAHSSKVEGIAASLAHVMSYSAKSMKLWDIASQKNVITLEKATKAATLCENMLYFEENASLCMMDIRDSAVHKVFACPANITAVAAAGNMVTAGLCDGTVIYSINKAKEKSFKAHAQKINNMEASLDRYITCASYDETITLFDTQNCEIIERRETGLDNVSVGVPADSAAVYTYPTQEGELELGSFEEALLRVE
ncbi:uncharacterized protein NEMAJ01_0460 [Nematocida major]|uniref:uncharacterized protein n=1 Tax=Nematocida major TaxID=1912982 RepID=UPI002007A32C|nr:uncharacterized protein NEMAJ01_0460 [Nematocida major]KAH9385564.1 hypothetical protein NEMAJ01_0460 [Nematocida major]